jgi:predicted PP-loop superfamily ATPase
MKLYTEEQVKEIYFKGVHNGRLHIEGKCSDEVESLTPIELPSDEEIKKESRFMDDILETVGFQAGSKFVIDRIQGSKQ